MKRSLLFTVIFLLFGSLSLWGQQNRLSLGLLGGPNLSDVRGNPIVENLNQPAVYFSGGVALQARILGRFSLRTELAFERKGAVSPPELRNGQGQSVATVYSQFDYLNLPVLLRFEMMETEPFRIFVQAGYYWGFLQWQGFVSKFSNNSAPIVEDNTFQISPRDRGLVTGLGADYSFHSKFRLSLELRHTLGLVNVSEVNVINEGDLKLMSANLLLGIHYQIW